MRWMLCLAASALLFAGCSSGYEPGDYYRRDGVKGIVIQTDDEGNARLLLSIDEVSHVDSDSALQWIASLGDTAWKLPTKEQMAIARKYRSAINITLRNKNLPTFLTDHTFYWTSTPCSESHVYACGPDGIRCYFKTNSSPYYRARAVRKLETR